MMDRGAYERHLANTIKQLKTTAMLAVAIITVTTCYLILWSMKAR